MAVVFLLFAGLVLLIILLLVYTTCVFRNRAEYFRKHKIPYIGGSIFRSFKFLTGYTNLISIQFEIYKKSTLTKAQIVGISDLFGGDSVHITDLNLIKNIFVKDFHHFVNRRPIEIKTSNKYLRKMLFSMESEQWIAIRRKISPCFTTGKIKRMFQIFKISCDRMDKYIKEMINTGTESTEINFSKIFPKYAMDVIASCAFGIDSKCFDVGPEQRSEFEEMGHQCQYKFDVKSLSKIFMMIVTPKIMDFLGIETMDYESTQYFGKVIRRVMKRRRETGERRDDFLQYMMDAQQGLLEVDDEPNDVMNGPSEHNNLTRGESEVKIIFDDDDITANGLLFLLGGFDTTQSVLLFTIYCLALEPEMQSKVFEEVTLVMEKSNKELTYEALSEMYYLDMVILETMRLYPPSVATERYCTLDYPVPGTDFVIRKGTRVEIPIHPIHHDPKYFPNPTKFMPERFSAEGKTARHPYAFMPFGHGPRNCVATRFALLKVKTAVAHLVKSFQFEPCPRSPIPMKFDICISIKPKHDMWMSVTPRCKTPSA